MSVDNFDIFACYRDLWKTASEKKNAIAHGIISDDDCTVNRIKLRINTGDKSAAVTKDKAIADAYGNKFIIPLDFEMLDSSAIIINKRDSETDYVMKLRLQLSHQFIENQCQE